MKSQLQVFSNLMPDEPDNRPHYRFMPGDLVGQIYKEFVNPECMHQCLTPKQQKEYLQYLPCLLCGRTCAGTCGLRPASH
jgi:hypothetical protein